MKKFLVPIFLLILSFLMLFSSVQAFAPENWTLYQNNPPLNWWDYHEWDHWRLDVWDSAAKKLYWKDTETFKDPAYGFGRFAAVFDVWGDRGMCTNFEQQILMFIRGTQTNGYPTEGNGIAIRWKHTHTGANPRTSIYAHLFLNGVITNPPILALEYVYSPNTKWHVTVDMYYYNALTVKADVTLQHYPDLVPYTATTTFGNIKYPDVYWKLYVPAPNNFPQYLESVTFLHDFQYHCYGGGGCPDVYYFTQGEWLDMGRFNIHGDGSRFAWDTLAVETQTPTKFVTMKLEEPSNSLGSEIDYLRLKAFDDSTFADASLVSAYHSEDGLVTSKVLEEDGDFAFLDADETLYLTFEVPSGFIYDELALSTIGRNLSKL